MKIFNAVLLACLFAAAVAQVVPEVEAQATPDICPFKKLDLGSIKAFDSAVDEKDRWSAKGLLKLEGAYSVKKMLKLDWVVKLKNNYGKELDYIDVDDCTVRKSGKSAVCKIDGGRVHITE